MIIEKMAKIYKLCERYSVTLNNPKISYELLY